MMNLTLQLPNGVEMPVTYDPYRGTRRIEKAVYEVCPEVYPGTLEFYPSFEEAKDGDQLICVSDPIFLEPYIEYDEVVDRDENDSHAFYSVVLTGHSGESVADMVIVYDENNGLYAHGLDPLRWVSIEEAVRAGAVARHFYLDERILQRILGQMEEGDWVPAADVE